MRRQRPPHSTARGDVEGGEGSSSSSSSGLGGQGPGQGDALGLPARERRGPPAGQGGESEASIQPARRPRRASAPAWRRLRRPNATLSTDGEMLEQQVVLEHDADAAAAPGRRTPRSPGRRGCGRRGRCGRHRAGGARPALDSGRLAGAVRAEQRHGLAAADVELDVEREARRPVDDRGRRRPRATHGARRPTSGRAAPPARRGRRQRSTRLIATAVSRSDSRATNTASGRVWVRPGRLPAKVIVAPNSPRARAQASTAPARSDGRDQRQGDPAEHGERERPRGWPPPPRSAGRCLRSAASTVMTRNGMATNVLATITPHVENGRRSRRVVDRPADQSPPAEREEQRRRRPRRAAAPSGRVTIARTTLGPGTRPGPAPRPVGRRGRPTDRGGRQRRQERQSECVDDHLDAGARGGRPTACARAARPAG